MINEDWSLEALVRQWGAERIRRAIQPLYLGVDEDNQIDMPDCESRRRNELPTYVINASVNDRPLWDKLNSAQQNTLLLTFWEAFYDVDVLQNDLGDILEPPGQEGCALADE